MPYKRRLLRILIALETAVLLYKYTPPNISKKTVSFFLPGEETVEFNDLDPLFRQRLNTVFSRMKKRGFSPKIYSAYRSNELQDFYYNASQMGRRIGIPSITNAKGGESCHNHRNADGEPASKAADIWGHPYGAFLSLGLEIHFAYHVQFFTALGQELERSDLLWGGQWPKKQNIWSKHGLGWDPSHVQLPKCR